MSSQLLVSSLVEFALLFGGQLETPPEQQEPIIASPRNLSESWVGSCLAGEVAFDLSEALMISNRNIDVGNVGERTRARLDGESLIILNGDPDRSSSEIIDVGQLISPNDDIDVSLNFMSLEGRIALYWRETYLNRRYRQGVFSFDGTGNIVLICEGVGGVDRSH